MDSVHYLPDETGNACPADQYQLLRRIGCLTSYQRTSAKPNGMVRLPLRYCSHCGTWYISRSVCSQLDAPAFKQDRFDIIGRPGQPRPAALAALHQTPQPTEKKSAHPRTPGRQRRRTSRQPDQRHLAIRLADCDGGRTDAAPGFRGLCSDAHYRLHVQHGDSVWCASRQNHCRQWTAEQMEAQDYPCLECHLLADWQFGRPTDGANDSPGRRIAGMRRGSLVLMTTMEPGTAEDRRYVFAVGKIANDPAEDNGGVSLDPTLRLELRPEEKLFFWDHVQPKEPSGDAPPNWGSVFYRNLDVAHVAALLRQALALISDPDREAIIRQMLEGLPPNQPA